MFIIFMPRREKNQKQLKAFGAHLKRLRKAKHISQFDLALRINSHQSTIYRIENGLIQPSLGMLIDIAQAIDVPLKELVDFY